METQYSGPSVFQRVCRYTKILPKMSSFDHRYDNLVDLVQTYPRMAIIRSFRYLCLTRLFQLQAELDAYERESQAPSNAPGHSAQGAYPGPYLRRDMTPYVCGLLKEYCMPILISVALLDFSQQD